jgi:predicted CXXCH cytochrome family protein
MMASARAGLAAALAVATLACARAPVQAPPPPIRAEFVPLPEAEVAGVKNPHLYQGKPLCERCHVPGAGLRSAPVALCLECHRFGHANHPVDVVQKGGARDLPLLAGNRLACHTCHDPHDLRKHRAGLRDEFTPLCLRCHTSHAR